MDAESSTFQLRLDERLTLAKVLPGDAAELFAVVEGSRMFLRDWLPWVDHNDSVADTEEFIARAVAQDREGNGFQCVARYRGAIVGVIGFYHVDWFHKHVEVGYWLAEDYQRRGIVTRACRALVGFAFTEWRLHRVAIHVAAANQRSRAVPERLGFTEEGTLRQAQWVNDRFHDTVVYGMLRAEWET